jgi:ElaA protein
VLAWAAMADQLRWRDHAFAELSVDELYAILALRQQVFVIEQNSVYLDVDGLDPVSRHIWAERPDRAIQGYLRIVPAGAKYAELSLGRIVTAPSARGTGLGRTLIERGLALAGAVPIRIGAQAHLQPFYRDHGFATAGDIYIEDGIPHVEMLRP